MTIVRLASIVLAAEWLLVGVAAAQTRGQDVPSGGRAEQGIFRSPNPRRPDQKNASFETTLRESYDGNIFGDQGSGIGADPRTQLGGLYSALDTDLSYNRRSDRSTLSFDLSSTVRYYPGFDRVHMGLQSFRLDWGQPLWRGARLVTTGDATYSPRFGIDVGNSAGLPFSFAPGVDDNSLPLALQYYRAGLGGEIQQSLGERAMLSVNSHLRASETAGRSDLMKAIQVGALLRHEWGRYAAWHASYTQQQADRGTFSRWNSQDASLGFDRRVPLSATRQATFAFSAGSTLLSDGSQTPRFRVMGDARASYDFGRSWNGSVIYRRGVGFVDPLPDPLLFDSMAFQLTGLTPRWMEWFASGSFQRGGVGLSDPAAGYDMYAARTRLTVSLSRRVAVYGEYFLYQYQFGEAVRLPIGLGRNFDRQGASVGLRLHTFF